MDFELLSKVKTSDKLCDKHKVNLVSVGNVQPFCTMCRKEMIEDQEKKIVEEAFKADRRRKTVEVLERDSIINDVGLWKASFDNYETSNPETEAALKQARIAAGEYLRSFEGNYTTGFNTLFSGVPGAGKSHLAMSMLKAVNEHSKTKVSCLFVSVNDLFRLIKSSFGKPDSKYTELNMTELLAKVDLLVLDDLGSEASFKRDNREASEYVQNVLFGILNARERTIITTNLNSEQLEMIYNPKIISRMYKNVSGHIIKFTSATSDKRTKIEF